MNWVFAKTDYRGNEASVTDIENFPKPFRLSKGISLKDSFPADVQFRMNNERPDSLELVDGLANTRELLLVTQKVCDLLLAEGLTNVEFLPVKILDHKGRVTPAPYFIVNVLSVVDCIDVAASTVEFNSITPDSISTVKKLILDPAKLPHDLRVFRPKRLTNRPLMDRALADRIVSTGARGFTFTEVGDFRY